MVRNKQSAIALHFLTRDFTLRNRSRLKDFVARLIRQEGHKTDHINYIFCSDAYLLQLNKEHLSHDTYTDIITFQLSPVGQPVLSDIYISIDRVRENAQSFHVPFSHELLRVMFHGALHLCGYKDKTPAQSKQMRQKEDHYLQRYLFHVKQKD